jgi:hypothetical protein
MNRQTIDVLSAFAEAEGRDVKALDRPTAPFLGSQQDRSCDRRAQIGCPLSGASRKTFYSVRVLPLLTQSRATDLN